MQSALHTAVIKKEKTKLVLLLFELDNLILMR